MYADLRGALSQLNKSWKMFEHNDEPMTKQQVKAVLEYGIEQGYESTSELSNQEIDDVLRKLAE